MIWREKERETVRRYVANFPMIDDGNFVPHKKIKKQTKNSILYNASKEASLGWLWDGAEIAKTRRGSQASVIRVAALDSILCHIAK